MSRRLKNTILASILAIYIICYVFFIFPNLKGYSESISATISIILMFLGMTFLGFYKEKDNELRKYVFNNTLFYIIMTFVITYMFGFAVKFLRNSYSLKPITLFNNILAPIIIAVTIELFRYTVISKNKDKKFFIVLITLLIILFELVLNIRFDMHLTPSVIFRLATSIILPTIFKNIYLSYMAYKIGYKSNITYRVILDTYVYVLPIFPNLSEYIKSMIFITLPILLYISNSSIIDAYDINKSRKEDLKASSKGNVLDIPFAIVVLVITALISGLFPLHMIGVGSSSMEPAINKGDAVIVYKIKDKQDVQLNDIVAYKRGKKLIVHRVVEIEEENGHKIYHTKGDANNANDSMDVAESDIHGVVKVKIPYIAYPSILLEKLIRN